MPNKCAVLLTVDWHFGYRRQWDPTVLTSSRRTDHTQKIRDRFAKTPPGTIDKPSRFLKLDPNGFSNTLRAGTDSARGAFYQSATDSLPIQSLCNGAGNGAAPWVSRLVSVAFHQMAWGTANWQFGAAASSPGDRLRNHQSPGIPTHSAPKNTTLGRSPFAINGCINGGAPLGY